MIPRVLVAFALVLAAVPATAETHGVAFETIALQNLPACEIASLLGPQFQYPADLPGAGISRRSGAQKSFPGVELITAAHPTSRYLLAAGTEEGVGQLRAFVRTLDVPQRHVQITGEVYPARPADVAGWSEAAATSTGIRVSTRPLRAGQKLAFPALPRGYQARQISVVAQQGRPELAPLPLFTGWPQVLLATAAEPGSTGTVRIGVGALEEGGSPAAAVREALELRTTLRLRSGERVGLMLSRGNSVITVILSAREL